MFLGWLGLLRPLILSWEWHCFHLSNISKKKWGRPQTNGEANVAASDCIRDVNEREDYCLRRPGRSAWLDMAARATKYTAEAQWLLCEDNLQCKIKLQHYRWEPICFMVVSSNALFILDRNKICLSHVLQSTKVDCRHEEEQLTTYTLATSTPEVWV